MTAPPPPPFPQKPEYCEQRGFHGPFLNTEVYDRTPGWEGFGDCEVCGSTQLRAPRGPQEGSIFPSAEPGPAP